MLKKLLTSGLIALASSSAFAGTFTLLRADGSRLTYYYDAPAAKGHPILVMLQDSACASAFAMYQATAKSVGTLGIATLALEKRGLGADTASAEDCPQEYLEHNTIDDRIADYLSVLAFLRKSDPGWNHKVGWAGESEGGVVASLVAPLVPETSLLLLFASGGGMTMADELLLLQRKQMTQSGASPEAIARAQSAMQSQFTEMRAHPTPAKEWRSDRMFERNTYLWWSVALDKKPIDSLLANTLHVPIYLAQGTADTAVPVESADLIAQAFRDQHRHGFTYRRYPGFDHHFADAQGQPHPEVLQDAQAWLVWHLKAPSSGRAD